MHVHMLLDLCQPLRGWQAGMKQLCLSNHAQSGATAALAL